MRAVLLAAVVAFAVVALVAAAAPLKSLQAAVHKSAAKRTHKAALAAPLGAVSAERAFGFPVWYEDSATHTRLEACVSGALCILPAASPGVFNPGAALTVPTNFPDEFFYYHVSAQLATPGCGNSPAGSALLVVGVEGAFANGLPAFQEQMAFGRIRLRVTSGLCANTAYTFVTPYGTFTHTMEPDGSLFTTSDIGCAGVQCDFAAALESPIMAAFARWSADLPAPPPGFLGDAVGASTSLLLRVACCVLRVACCALRVTCCVLRA